MDVIYYDKKLGPYLIANNLPGQAYDDGSGQGSQYFGDSPPDVATVAAWEQTPVTDVYSQTVKTLSEREDEASPRITDLKASTLLHLVAVGASMADGNKITEANVNDEGTRFIFYHAAVISAFKLAGGSNVAGQELYKAFTGAGSKSLFPWVDEKVEAIFQSYLIPQK